MPDPLLSFDGRPVTTPEQWFSRRRPELKALFQYYMYGRMPPRPDALTFAIEREDRGFLDGKATLKEVTVTVGPAGVPRIHLLVVVPNRRDGPAPTFLGVNFRGNHAVVRDPKVAPPEAWLPGFGTGPRDARAIDAARGTEFGVWAVDEVVARGYALATYYCGDVAPDHKGVVDGIFPHYFKPGQTKPGPHDWGAIAAWAWGLSRAIDYLVTDKDIDGSRVAVVGWSRMGKASIVAAAFDERVALVIPHQAGCGGTSPSRAVVGETVKRINNGNPHWFAAEFKKFNDRPEKLPFDQNCLVALVAPRPVLFTNAVKDEGANPEGQFQVLRAAEPVYRLLGGGGLDAKDMPAPNTLISGTLGYHIRLGTHSMGREDWDVFLKYADAQFRRPSAR
ncbi:MAG: acetylxylan esterase [Planctomycetia bacterium]|nr:acetylxylan esterase [Planctomycetia bacterium]